MTFVAENIFEHTLRHNEKCPARKKGSHKDRFNGDCSYKYI